MADVLADLKNWSATASSNLPSGATSIGTGLDDNLRQLQATVRQDLASVGANIASAGTCDLGAVAGLFHTITGTTTITSFGTVAAGIWKVLTFSGALTITHNGTSLICPYGANITTTANDTLLAESLGSGNWKIHPFHVATLYAALAGSVSQAFSVASLEVGHASDTTLTRSAAGVVAVEGVDLLKKTTIQTFTPALTFATPGDLSVAYTQQTGFYEQIGNTYFCHFAIITSSFTHTTASGACNITGFPVAGANISGNTTTAAVQWSGITKAGYTQISGQIPFNSTVMSFLAFGSGVGRATVNAADMPTGGSVVLMGTVVIIAA